MHTESMDTGELWQAFHDELHRFVKTRVPSEAAAQDILQSTFLRAHTQLDAGEYPAQPRAWLYQIMRNLIVDSYRHQTRERRLEDAMAHAPTPLEDNTEGDGSEVFEAVARTLPLFIDGLAPDYRDALRMTELEGLTRAEAAERAGLSLSGMKSRVQRGRRQVFDALKRCCSFELDARGRMMACEGRQSGGDCCPTARG